MSDFVDYTNLPKASSSIDLSSSMKKITEAGKSLLGFGKTDQFTKMTAVDLPKVVQDPIKAANTAAIAQAIQTTNNVSAAQAIVAAHPATSIRDGFDSDDVRVTLYSPNEDETVTFVATPIIEEQRDAVYDEVAVTHHPGAILMYKGTTIRTWNISGIKLISRTPDEAADNLKLLNTVRSWVMPYYGYGTEAAFPDKLGAPPPVLEFSAYGPANVDSVKVALLNYHFTYPNEVDYIPCSGKYGSIDEGTPFPIISELSISLKEAYSPNEYSSFDLVRYKLGDLSGAFPGLAMPEPLQTTPVDNSAQTVKTEEQAATPAQSAQAKPQYTVNGDPSADAFKKAFKTGGGAMGVIGGYITKK